MKPNKHNKIVLPNRAQRLELSINDGDFAHFVDDFPMPIRCAFRLRIRAVDVLGKLVKSFNESIILNLPDDLAWLDFGDALGPMSSMRVSLSNGYIEFPRLCFSTKCDIGTRIGWTIMANELRTPIGAHAKLLLQPAGIITKLLAPPSPPPEIFTRFFLPDVHVVPVADYTIHCTSDLLSSLSKQAFGISLFGPFQDNLLAKRQVRVEFCNRDCPHHSAHCVCFCLSDLSLSLRLAGNYILEIFYIEDRTQVVHALSESERQIRLRVPFVVKRKDEEDPARRVPSLSDGFVPTAALGRRIVLSRVKTLRLQLKVWKRTAQIDDSKDSLNSIDKTMSRLRAQIRDVQKLKDRLFPPEKEVFCISEIFVLWSWENRIFLLTDRLHREIQRRVFLEDYRKMLPQIQKINNLWNNQDSLKGLGTDDLGTIYKEFCAIDFSWFGESIHTRVV